MLALAAEMIPQEGGGPQGPPGSLSLSLSLSLSPSIIAQQPQFCSLRPGYHSQCHMVADDSSIALSS